MTRTRTIWLTSLAAVAIHVGIVAVGIDRSLPFALLWTAGYAVAIATWWSLRGAPLDRKAIVVLVGAAIVCRLVLFAGTSTLSDDGWRYLWDGAKITRGQNPYESFPDQDGLGDVSADEAASLRDLRSKINRPGLHTVYSPLSQALFAGGYALGGPRLDALRVAFLLFDLLTIPLLFALLRRLDLPARHALLWIWSPMASVEMVGTGHSEMFMIPLLVWAAIEALDGRPIRFGLAAGLAFLAKFTAAVPLVVLLAVAVRRRSVGERPGRVLGVASLVALAVVVAGFAPFWHDRFVANISDSLRLYAGRFEFDAGPFYAARWLFERVGLTGTEGYFGGSFDADFPVVTTLSALTVLAIAAAVFVRPPTRGAAWIDRATFAGAIYVVLQSVMHPWYLGVFLPLMVVVPRASWLFLAASVGWTHLFYGPGGVATEPTWALTLQWGAFVLIVVVEAFLRRSRGPLKAAPRNPDTGLSPVLDNRDQTGAASHQDAHP